MKKTIFFFLVFMLIPIANANGGFGPIPSLNIGPSGAWADSAQYVY